MRAQLPAGRLDRFAEDHDLPLSRQRAAEDHPLPSRHDGQVRRLVQVGLLEVLDRGPGGHINRETPSAHLHVGDGESILVAGAAREAVPDLRRHVRACPRLRIHSGRV